MMLTIIRHLDRRIFRPELAVINLEGPLSREIAKDIRVHKLKFDRVRYSFPSIFRLCWLYKPDIIITTLGYLNLFLLSCKFLLPHRIKIIAREANTASMRLLSSKHRSLYRFFYKILYPRADRIICNSKYMQRDLIEHFGVPASKTVFIPNPVDITRIQGLCNKGKNPYKQGKVHLVTVGRLIYQKGFDLLFRSISKVVDRLPAFDLTVVGDGPEMRSLKRMIENLKIADHVKFVCRQDNPFIYMAHADLFISSSRWEGLPNVVLESLACGTPVLAFDCPGGTGEIIRHGVNGWLVPSGDMETMSEMIVELVKGRKWREFQSRELVPEEFKCPNVVARYEDLMLEVYKTQDANQLSLS